MNERTFAALCVVVTRDGKSVMGCHTGILEKQMLLILDLTVKYVRTYVRKNDRSYKRRFLNQRGMEDNGSIVKLRGNSQFCIDNQHACELGVYIQTARYIFKHCTQKVELCHLLEAGGLKTLEKSHNLVILILVLNQIRICRT